jgi:hypothetical protein
MNMSLEMRGATSKVAVWKRKMKNPSPNNHPRKKTIMH